MPREHHFEVFHESTAPLFDTASLGEVREFTTVTTDYLVDDLVVSRLRYEPQTLHRTQAHLDDGTSQWVTVQVYLDGNLTGRAGDRP